ncbi:MAG: hypothetical protein NC392_15665 [Roseburia sp.]|nr:hypothetical protein [Roseburia sp.]
MDTNINSIIEILHLSYPDKTLVDISDYEDEKHQTYKYLYEQQSGQIGQQTEELYSLRFQLQDREREISELKNELEIQRSVNSRLNDTTTNIMEFVRKFTEQDITVSNIRAMDGEGNEIIVNSDIRESHLDTISATPGIYGGKRPSWFTPLRVEINKENTARKCADHTKHVLKDKLMFWKRMKKDLAGLCQTGTNFLDEIADRVDSERKEKISSLLKSGCSNEEKYLKYFLLTPGMPRDFFHT